MGTTADKNPGELLGAQSDGYGADYHAHLLAQYKLYVEMADRVSRRRENANAFFLTINTAIFGLLKLPLLPLNNWFPFVMVSAAGITLCIAWLTYIRSYRDLNTAKFAVVGRLEEHLPVRPYHAEWVAVGQGRNPRLYRPLSHVEAAVPWVFLILHVVVAVLAITLRQPCAAADILI
jgi:hypothetical protein